MPVVLRVDGEQFDIKRFRQLHDVDVSGIYERGFPKRPYNNPGNLNSTSGLNILVGDGDFYDFSSQVTQAIRFLREHRKLVRSLRKIGATELSLDFAVANKGSASQSERMTSELLQLVAEMGIEIEITHYLIAGE